MSISTCLNKDWYIKNIHDVQQDGRELSRPETEIQYTSWLKALVPGTVLSALVENGVFSDPYIEQNGTAESVSAEDIPQKLQSVQNAPDIKDVGTEFYTYWWLNQFELTSLQEGECVYIEFRGINYSAEIYVNGTYIEPQNDLEGMFIRHRLNISEQAVNGVNRIAVLVRPTEYPGEVTHKPGDIGPGQGQGGLDNDKKIARGVTAQYVAGWDWMMPIRDRSTGLWDKVFVHLTGPLSIRDPFVSVSFPDDTYTSAVLKVTSDIVNLGATIQTGTLSLKVDGQSHSVAVTAKSGETLTVTFDPITLNNPRLWWPNGQGTQELYTAEFILDVNGFDSSDNQSVGFGVREVKVLKDHKLDRYFRINGQKIFIRGGNWIASDAMYRLTERRYRNEVRMHAAMNMNMIRVWGGGITERPEFYDACDEYGILVWQEFWNTGDCNGRWETGSILYPDDEDLVINCAKDMVRMLRNHPSLAVWVGSNEFYPAKPLTEKKYSPQKTLNDELANVIIPDLDGTRPYVPGSLNVRSGIEGFSDGDGPYGILETRAYFNPEGWGGEKYTHLWSNVLNPEIGSIGFPTLESLKTMMPNSYMNLPAFNLLNDNSKETIQEYTESGTPTWDVTWEWHTYQPFSIPSTNTAQYPTVTDQLALYGIPGKPEAFCEQAQLAAYDQYRALVEGSNSRMWINCNGMLIWKSQNPWTGLRGSLYDWYLEQTGGFFGCLHAAEPVHVQFNLYSKQIEVVNSTGNDVSNVKLNAKVIGLDGKMTTIFDDTISVSKLTTKAFEIKEPLNEEGIYFLLLELSESEKAEQKEQKTPCIISRNFYWLSTEDGPKRFEELQEWRTTKTPVSITGTGKRVGSSFDIDLELVNETGGNTDVKANVAFWIRFQVFTPETVPERILPVFYEDNYISLAPMEKRYLHINLETDTIASTQEPIISISGWNVDSQTVNIIWD